MADLVGRVAQAIELAGVAVLVAGGLLATALAVQSLLHRRPAGEVYRQYRRGIGLSILLGLEFLVAADIIQTILIDPTLRSAAALGIIVLIRTFLSFSLETEIEGVPPWRRRRSEELERRAASDAALHRPPRSP